MDPKARASTRPGAVAGEQPISDAAVPLDRILVPLDGSRLAEYAMGAAASLAARFHARLLLLHVLERGAPATVHGDRHLTGVEEAEAYLREVTARWSGHGSLALEWHVHPNEQGDVPKSIIDHAIDFGADLVVLSTHGAGGTRRALFGSVAQQVLRRGLHPVLLVRPPTAPSDAAPFAPRRILVPLDGTASSAALPLAGTLAKAYGAELHFLRVVPTLNSLSGERAPTALLAPSATAVSLDLEEAEAKSQVTRLVSRLRGQGLHVSGEVLRGEPSQGIIDEARRVAPDIIVMATRGRTGLDALFSGSVAGDIAGKLSQPILLVRVRNGDTPP